MINQNSPLSYTFPSASSIAGILPPANGGTGVANTATLTITGASALTLTLTGSTNVTLPTSGTLVNSAVTSLASLATVGTIGTGVWQGTAVDAQYGGTGQSSYSTGNILYASGASTLSKLAIGGSNTALVVAGGVPTWAAIVNSIAGTANQITASAATGSVTLSLPSALTLPGSVTMTGGLLSVTTTAAAGSLFVKGTGTMSGPIAEIQLDDQGGTRNALYVHNLSNWAQTGVFVQITSTNGSDTGALISMTNAGTGNYITCDSNASITKNGMGSFKNVATSANIIKTADFTVGAGEGSFTNNKSGSTCTVTLPTASSFTGRWIYLKNFQAQTVVSASSNVKPIGSDTAGTAILASGAGKWAALQSDGSNWVVMMSN